MTELTPEQLAANARTRATISAQLDDIERLRRELLAKAVDPYHPEDSEALAIVKRIEVKAMCGE